MGHVRRAGPRGGTESGCWQLLSGGGDFQGAPTAVTWTAPHPGWGARPTSILASITVMSCSSVRPRGAGTRAPCTGAMSAVWGGPCRRVRIRLWSVMCVDGRCGGGRCRRRPGKRRSGPVPGAMPPPMWAASGSRSRDRRTCPWRCAGKGLSRTAFPLVSPTPSASSTRRCAGSRKLACRRPTIGGCRNGRAPVGPVGKQRVSSMTAGRRR